ncbi:hypothetical protein Bca101_007485 [Brassica carinata]
MCISYNSYTYAPCLVSEAFLCFLPGRFGPVLSPLVSEAGAKPKPKPTLIDLGFFPRWPALVAYAQGDLVSSPFC